VIGKSHLLNVDSCNSHAILTSIFLILKTYMVSIYSNLSYNQANFQTD